MLGYSVTSGNSINNEMLSFMWIFFGASELVGICIGIGLAIEEEDQERKLGGKK